MCSRTRSVSCRREVNDLLLCLVAAEEDSEDEDAIEDIEMLMAFNLFNEPFGDKFRIDLEKIDQKMCIELFRYDALN